MFQRLFLPNQFELQIIFSSRAKLSLIQNMAEFERRVLFSLLFLPIMLNKPNEEDQGLPIREFL